MICKRIWLIGTGSMAVEYSKVLDALKIDYLVVGRSENRCEEFFNLTGKIPFKGGLAAFLKSNPEIPDAVINATGIESLTHSTSLLLNYGIRYILLEKPGFGNPEELFTTKELVDLYNAKVLIAYNRRFYSSVIKSQEIIDKDGGVKSFNFEFTEWSHTIKELKKEKVEFENWFYGNSSHLIDLAFYLCGNPIEINCFQKGGLEWHPSGEVFSGAGITESNALFSYIANWSSPGRWGLEICTSNYRLIFKPIEKLHIMKLGSVTIEENDQINYEIDQLYKPGLYLQTEAFLKKEISRFSDINDQLNAHKNFYSKINKK
jgi:predicted dehydrogenase